MSEIIFRPDRLCSRCSMRIPSYLSSCPCEAFATTVEQRTAPNRCDGLPFGELASELDRVGTPRHAMDRQWAWRDLLLEVTYMEEDARKYRMTAGARPWTVPRGVWSGG